MLQRTRMLVGSSLIAVAAAASAGTVEVTFIGADNYWDAGNTSWDEPGNLKLLATHLQKLGRQWLAADQVLKIDVLQVDLAGSVRPFHGTTAIRIINKGPDLPKLHMRYSLLAGDKALASGDEWVTELDVLNGLPPTGDSGPLFYEKRMLDHWFKARFVDALAAPG